MFRKLRSFWSCPRWYHSPRFAASILWRMVSNLPSQWQVFSLLRQSPDIYVPLLYRCPRFFFKYLKCPFLATHFTIIENAGYFLWHYRKLNQVFTSEYLRRILYCHVEVADWEKEGNRMWVTMGRARSRSRREGIRNADKEGEMRLTLYWDNAPLYTLAFTVVPGSAVQSVAHEVILIGQLQGLCNAEQSDYGERCDPIHQAARLHFGMRLPSLLMAVLQGVGRALDIQEMAGVSISRQACFIRESAGSFYAAYDRFFSSIGAVRNEAGFYLSTLEPQEKSEHSALRGSRSRSKKKHALRDQIAEKTCATLSAHLRARRVASSPVPDQSSEVVSPSVEEPVSVA